MQMPRNHLISHNADGMLVFPKLFIVDIQLLTFLGCLALHRERPRLHDF